MATMAVSDGTEVHPRIRLMLGIGFAFATLLVAAALAIYRAPGDVGTRYLLLGAVEIITLLVLGVVIALFGTRTRSVDGSRILRAGVVLGAVLGLLWVVEINYNNILTPPVEIRDPVDNIFWAVIALGIFIFSIVSAFRTRRFLRGVQAGFWSGTVSGLVACLMGLVLVVFLIQLVANDPVSIQEWNDIGVSSGAPNITIYFAYETLAGAFLHLIVLGIVMGVLLGALGGAIGKVASLLAPARV